MELNRPTGGSEVTSFPALPSSTKPAQRRGSGNTSETGPRLRQLESRLNINEQSNRALLEELVRLQGELKSCMRRNEDSLRGEKEERLILSEKIRAATNLYTQMTMRLARTEERLESERDAVGSLVNHTKQVEQAIIGSQQQLISRREQAHVQMERIKDDIDELRETFEQAQKNMRAMAADLRTFKSKQEISSEHFGTTIQEIRQRMKKVEGQTQLAVDAMTRQQDGRDSIESTSVQFRNLVESRLSEVKEAVNDLRRRMDFEEAERKSAAQQNQLSAEQLRTLILEVDRKREEDLYSTSRQSKDNENMMEAERSALASKMAEMSEEQSKKMLQKEIRLREDAQSKFVALERRYREEQGARLGFEKSVREEIEKRWEALKSYVDEEIQSLRESEKLSQVRSDQSLVRLNESISLLERHIDEGKKSVEHVLHAEITSRQSQNEKLSARCGEIQDKLNTAISTLQQAVGGINDQTSGDIDQVKKELKSMIEENMNSGVKGLSDMDIRLKKLNRKLVEVEEAVNKLDKRPPPRAAIPVITFTKEPNENSEDEEGKESREAEHQKLLDQVSRWQNVTEESVKEIQSNLQPLPEEIYQLRNELKQIKDEIEAQERERKKSPAPVREPSPVVSQEPEYNKEETADLRTRVQKLEDELRRAATQLSKLESTVQTVRTVLTQKIQSEAQTSEMSPRKI